MPVYVENTALDFFRIPIVPFLKAHIYIDSSLKGDVCGSGHDQ
jgi:hypothetical protein